MDEQHQLDQLGASLAAIVTSLREHLQDSDGGNENNINDNHVAQDAAALATTLSGVVEGLTSIRNSIGDIARILAEHRKESPSVPSYGNVDEKRDKTVELSTDDFPISGVRSQLDVCYTGCRTVLEKLDGVAAALGPNPLKKTEVYDDSDWESVAESAGGSQLLGRHHEEVLSRVEAVIGPLGGALGILIGVFSARTPADKEMLLNCSTTRDNFRQLERRLAELSVKNESRGPRWGTLLKPLRLLGGKAANNSTGRLQSKPSKPSLARAKTWPTLFKGTAADSEEEEARKRSAMIDKQIEEQSIASRNTCTVVIAWGRHAPNILLTDTFARLSIADGAVAKGRDLPGVADSSNIQSVTGCIRRQIAREARKMVSAYRTETMGEQEVELTKKLTDLLDGKGEEEGLLSGKSQELMRQWDSWRSREPPGMMDGWGECRLPEFDDIIIEAFHRASLENFIPTTEDHRRFFADRAYSYYCETFSFEADPVAIRILDPRKFACCNGKARHLYRLIYQESTSAVFLFNLANYDETWEFEEQMMTGFSQFLESFSNITNYQTPGTPPPSAIIIMYNVSRFVEKLKRKPMSSLRRFYKDYTGEGNPKSVIAYMINKCRQGCEDKRRIYPHVGELWDESTVKFIRVAAKESMLHSALKETGLF